MLPQRLGMLHQELTQLLRDHRPTAAAVEELFFSKNVKTALQVGHARGVILLALAGAEIPTREFTPNEIKQALTGFGGADKHQMQSMIKAVLKLETMPRPDDAADALAVAVCAAHTMQ